MSDHLMIKDARGGRGEAMDTTTRERDIVKEVIQRYAQFKPSHGDIRLGKHNCLRKVQNIRSM
ncbi:hypothetical protein NDI49_19390 [Trichocoleus sp. ST-U3]